MEAGIQAAKGKAAGAAAGASSAAASAGQKAGATLGAAVPGKSSQAGGFTQGAFGSLLTQMRLGASTGRESFEIEEDKDHPHDKKHYNEWIANITVEV